MGQYNVCGGIFVFVIPSLNNYLSVASICLGFRRSQNGQGNECTFEDKVRAAMKANYSAAIIYNYKNDELIPMGGDSDDLIPSVFIGYSDDYKILEHYTFSKGEGEYVVRITDNAPFD